MWNRTSIVQDALALRESGGTSASTNIAVVPSPVHLAKDGPGILLYCTSHSRGDVVFQEAPGPPAWPLELLEGGESSDDLEDPVLESPRTLADETFLEWRVKIKVLGFQTPATYHAMWVARHEDISTFIARAEILLRPIGGMYELLCFEPQPRNDCVTFACIPVWWQLHGVYTAVVTCDEPEARDFIVTANRGDVVEDVLPLRAQARDRTVDVFCSERPASALQQGQPSTSDENFHGAVIRMQQPGGATPAFPFLQALFIMILSVTAELPTCRDMSLLPRTGIFCSALVSFRPFVSSALGLQGHSCRLLLALMPKTS